MKHKLLKLIRNPVRYFPKARTAALQPLCQIFKGTGFFLQGQMDISPKSLWHSPEFASATGGFYPNTEEKEVARRVVDLDAHDNTRRDMLALLLRTIITKHIEGHFAELGVWKGYTAKLFHHYAPERKLHLFDTFEGFTVRGAAAEEKNTAGLREAFKIDPVQFSDTSLAKVKAYIGAQNDNVAFHPGFFPDSIPGELHAQRFAFVHLDADLYEPILEGLKFFYPRMSRYGLIVVHDYNSWPGARKAVDDFFGDKVELPVPMPDKNGSALIVKQ